jgi:hypothetical protein
VDLPEPAGETVSAGEYPATFKLAQVPCQAGVVRHASSTEALKHH